MRKIATLSLLVAAAAFAAFAASTGYHVVKEIKIGGEGGWDYPEMDSAARRLYLSHATHVVVVDHVVAANELDPIVAPGDRVVGEGAPVGISPYRYRVR